MEFACYSGNKFFKRSEHVSVAMLSRVRGLTISTRDGLYLFCTYSKGFEPIRPI